MSINCEILMRIMSEGVSRRLGSRISLGFLVCTTVFGFAAVVNVWMMPI